MLEHSSGPVPAEALMDDESVTDNFEYNSAPSFQQRYVPWNEASTYVFLHMPPSRMFISYFN